MTTFFSSFTASHYFQLPLFPLVLLDLSVQTLLFIYAMSYQVILYGVYIGLFIVCTITGHYHKLEKPGESPDTKSDIRTRKKKQRLQRKQIRCKKIRKNIDAHNDSGYYSDFT